MSKWGIGRHALLVAVGGFLAGLATRLDGAPPLAALGSGALIAVVGWIALAVMVATCRIWLNRRGRRRRFNRRFPF